MLTIALIVGTSIFGFITGYWGYWFHHYTTYRVEESND